MSIFAHHHFLQTDLSFIWKDMSIKREYEILHHVKGENRWSNGRHHAYFHQTMFSDTNLRTTTSRHNVNVTLPHVKECREQHNKELALLRSGISALFKYKLDQKPDRHIDRVCWELVARFLSEKVRKSEFYLKISFFHTNSSASSSFGGDFACFPSFSQFCLLLFVFGARLIQDLFALLNHQGKLLWADQYQKCLSDTLTRTFKVPNNHLVLNFRVLTVRCLVWWFSSHVIS